MRRLPRRWLGAAFLSLGLAVLASHAMRAQQAGPTSQPVGPTGTIAGRVVNAATGGPATGLDVVFQNDVGRRVASATTDASGRYTSSPLPVGDYYVRTASLNPLGLVPQFFDKIPAGDRILLRSWDEMKQCTAVTVTASHVTGGIDFALEPGGAITGTVRNAVTGARVPKARVGAGGVETVADADGVYRVTGLASGSYPVMAEASEAGLLPAMYPANSISSRGPAREPVATVVVKAPAVTAGIDIALQPGGAITGRVTDKTTGAPIPGVTITAGRGAGTTDANGDYSIRGLPTDSFEVFARAPSSSGYIDQLYDGVSCRSQGCDLKLGTKVRVTAPETTARVDFRPQRGAQIAGRVTNAATGAPVAGVDVTFHPVADGALSAASTNAQGRYVSTGLLPGPYYVYTGGYTRGSDGGMLNQIYPGKPVERDRVDLRSGTPVTAVEGSAIGGIDFALVEGGSISGVVTEAGTGAPVRGVRIDVSSPPTSRYGVTDPAGRYTVAGLRTGSYRVSARPAWEGTMGAGMKHAFFLESLLPEVYVGKEAAGADRQDGTPVVVTAPGAVTGIDFALVRGGAITGTVVNARTGEPEIDISVVASGERVGSHGRTDAHGRYEITGLPGGRYAVHTRSGISMRPQSRVLDQGYKGVPCWTLDCAQRAGTAVSVSAGRTTPGIDFSLAEGGVISGVIMHAATGDPIAGGRVELYTADGSRLFPVESDSQGRYTTGGLPSGTYFAVGSAGLDSTRGLSRQLYKGRPCAGAEYSPCDPKGGTPIVVTAPDTATGIDFALTNGGTISGVVTVASTGAPIPGARVGVYAGSLGIEQAATAKTGAEGRYQVSGLADGRYYVQVEPPETKDDFDRVRPKFPGLLDQVYPGVGCSRYRCYEARLKGKPVVVGAGAPATEVDFRLRLGGTVSGRVTDASSGEPVRNALVSFHSASGFVAHTATTDFEGKYTASPVPPGSYYLRTQPRDDAPVAGALYPAVPYWPGNLSVESGTPVAVDEGGAATGKDFALASGGVIQGKVTWADSGKPVPYYAIRVYTHAGVLAATDNFWARSAPGDGAYTIPALPPGKYFVMTAEGETHGYIDQIYSGVACPREACRPTAGTPVIIGGPGVVSGVDFALRPGPARATTSARLSLRPGRVWIEPGSGPASGGSLVTISGGPFDDWGTKVLIGGVPAVSVEWRNLVSLKVVMPPGKPGLADIVVTTPEGSLVLRKGYTYVAGRAVAPPRR